MEEIDVGEKGRRGGGEREMERKINVQDVGRGGGEEEEEEER